MTLKSKCAAFLIVLIFALSACGQSNTGSSSTQSGDSGTTPQTEASDTSSGASDAADTPTDASDSSSEAAVTVPKDWKEPYAEPITVTICNVQYAAMRFAPGEDAANNLWTKRFKELYNVDVVVVWTADSADYDQKLNLAIAAADIPDSFLANNNHFKQLKDAEMLQDITDAFESNASPQLKEMMDDDKEIFDTAKINGRVYGIPGLHYGYITMLDLMWIRNDWVAQSSTGEPKSFQDYEALMAEFKDKFGAEYGLPLDRRMDPFLLSAPMWHASPNRWVKDSSGQIVYGATLPETKTALAKWADWYSQGYIRPDFATIDDIARNQDIVNGKIGLHPGQNWLGWVNGVELVQNHGNEAYFRSFTMFAEDGKQVKQVVEFPNGWYTVVRKGYEHPEVLPKLVSDYAYITGAAVSLGDVDVEDVLPFTTNDMHHVPRPFYITFPKGHDVDTVEVTTAIETGVEKFSAGWGAGFYAESKKWVDEKDTVGLGRWLQMGSRDSSLWKNVQRVEAGECVRSDMWGMPPDTLLEYGEVLNDVLFEGYARIIMGSEPIDYFETLIDNWRAAGGDAATAAVNEVYGS